MNEFKSLFVAAVILVYAFLVLSSHAILFSTSTSAQIDGAGFDLNCSYFTGISVIEKKYGFYKTTSKNSVACPRILDFSRG